MNISIHECDLHGSIDIDTSYENLPLIIKGILISLKPKQTFNIDINTEREE